MSAAVEAEIREVFGRPKFMTYLTAGRAVTILAIVTGAAHVVQPTERVFDCRDAKDNKYLELALAARAETIISSDDDLLALHPWRGVAILTPTQFVARLNPT